VRLIPETRMQEHKRPPKTLRRVIEGHEGDWIRACKNGPNGSRRTPRLNTAARSRRWCCSAFLAIRMKDQRLGRHPEEVDGGSGAGAAGGSTASFSGLYRPRRAGWRSSAHRTIPFPTSALYVPLGQPV
jgi:hypothetical protein